MTRLIQFLLLPAYGLVWVAGVIVGASGLFSNEQLREVAQKMGGYLPEALFASGVLWLWLAWIFQA